MFAWLTKLLSDPTKSWPRSLADDVLGKLRLSGDADSWEATVTINGEPLEFHISGEGRPDPALLMHAHSLIGNLDAFREQVRAFLEVEPTRVRALAPYADEIRRLVLQDVTLFSPEPVRGMLYFRGPDESRVWRCDYIDGTPRDLGFDS